MRAMILRKQAAPLMCAGVVGFRALRLAGVGGEDSISSVAQASRLREDTWRARRPPHRAVPRRLGLYGLGASAHVAIARLAVQRC